MGLCLVQIMNEGKNEGDCHAACIEEVCVYFVEIYVGCRVVATYMPLNEAKILDQN